MEVRSPAPPRPAADTSRRILEVAERLVQTRGFNGFSYADIAAEVGVTKASLHYHFSSKAELGRRLIESYRGRFLDALRRVDEAGGVACDRLGRYVEIYERVLGDDRMCLCGMLAAEYATLPETMRDGLKAFFEANEAWLSAVLEKGRAAGELEFAGAARAAANALTGALEGTLLLARAHGDRAVFRASAELLIGNFCRAAPTRKPRPRRARTVRDAN